MSLENTSSTAPVAESQQTLRRQNRRKRHLILLTLLFILIAAGFAAMYFLVWQHEESTDDAYVNGHTVQITPQITGTVQAVNVDDTDIVKTGQLLIRLDDSDMRLAYERAQSELINAIRQNQQQTAALHQAQAQVNAKKVQLDRLQADLARRENLAGTDAISAEELNHARAAVTEAQAALSAAKAQDRAAQAALGHDVPLRQQPAVLMAISHVKEAWLNLQRTHIKAPIDGQVAKRNIQVGQKVAPGTPMMAVVPLHNVWVDANFKETQLANLRIGQPAEIIADIYGSDVKYHGQIVGLSAGTGSAFALLPAQNATGNWIKVVQRLPVRIALDPQEIAAHPLRVGLSMSVEVDTSNKEGQPVSEIHTVANAQSLPDEDWTPVNTVIDQIFANYAQ